MKVTKKKSVKKAAAYIYNQKQKQDYINFVGANQETLKRYFNRISDKEKEYKKDIVDMNNDELRDTIYSLGIRRSDSIGHFISLLKGYVNWAILYKKTDNSNIISSISPESLISKDVIKQTMIKNPAQVRERLINTLDYNYYKNRSNRDSLVIWLLYCGVPMQEFPTLKKTGIDTENKKIKTGNGGEYFITDEIFDEVASLWAECAEMNFVEKKNGKSENSKNGEEYIKYNLIDNDYLFRPIEGKKENSNCKFAITVFRSIVYNIFQGGKETDNIPARNLNYSGIFYQLYKIERSGAAITPEIIAEYFKIHYTEKKDLLLKTRKWRVDYEDWKLAFDYM